MNTSRTEVLRFRFMRHQLDREAGTSDVGLLDYGIQDTGGDGAAWALAIRGGSDDDDLVYAWTLRGAPHAYRRQDIGSVAVATAPLSEADAAKRVFDAAKPLRAAGLDVLAALAQIAREMREIATKPVAKGEMSAQLTERLPEPFLRFCRPCNATHVYEQPFRLAALQAGLALDPGTSPPVLRRIPQLTPPMYRSMDSAAEPRFDVVRNYLRFFGPATPKQAAEFLDAPVKEVQARWPDDVVEVFVGREKRWLLEADADALADTGAASGVLRVLGPYDPYLQTRDRELLVPDETQRKDLWRVLGRPGAVVVDGEVVATWRPKQSGKKLTVAIEPWRTLKPGEMRAVGEQAELLAAHRGVTSAGVIVGS